MILHIYVKKKSKCATVHRTGEARQQGRPKRDAWSSKRRGNRSNVLVPVGAGWYWNLTDWLIRMNGGGEC